VKSNALGVSIRGNSIYSNGAGGIDLNGDGFTQNDAGDADAGGNERQNFPQVFEVTPFAGGTTIKGFLDSTPDTSFRIEFFTGDNPDANGVVQGRTFLGFVNVVSGGTGFVNFNTNIAPV